MGKKKERTLLSASRLKELIVEEKIINTPITSQSLYKRFNNAYAKMYSLKSLNYLAWVVKQIDLKYTRILKNHTVYYTFSKD